MARTFDYQLNHTAIREIPRHLMRKTFKVKTKLFEDRMAELGYTKRSLSKEIQGLNGPLDHAALIRRLDGSLACSAWEAGQLSIVLDLPLTTVFEWLGIKHR